ncbi:aspartate carbamoyltransferase [Candidatus Haliotispira prima]|uniref:Aspartate carbamoyltransferase n=1 Tax=Candidatus Haliotispira prima TaxID=3034016 RepID=A0ABY8MK11_9SPIO|nr:aspartate carbamoyltransferase [Candidatus Haliotispira prima]
MADSITNSWFQKSISVIADCSLEERKYLFQQSRILKEAMQEQNEEVLDRFRISDPSFGIYEIFLEDSTRTRESFRNAAKFLRVNVSDMISGSSSLNKSESFRDTFHTLIGYSNHIFIVRSKQEGLCRWLAKSSKVYCGRMGTAFIPSFVNGGDGEHEHPTQELYDDFTFLEDLQWNYDKIHVALIGDLLHNRTIHSKINGLQIFNEVEVDLIAPGEMGLPRSYYQIMAEKVCNIRIFASLDEYLEQKHVAPMWYFTRLQLERMDEMILRREGELRYSVTLRPDHLPVLQKLQDEQNCKIKFYHPMPRHKQFPVIPTFLDNTPYNGWERQSANGLIVRITLLALIAGRCPPPVGLLPREETESKPVKSYEELPILDSGRPKVYSEGLRPIRNGIVIDHILRGSSPPEIRCHMRRITELMGLDRYRGGQWVGSSHKDSHIKAIYKGLIFVPEAKPFSPEQLRKLSAIAPHITINYIQDGQVQSKYRLLQPPRIYGFSETRCRNRNCISHESHHEGVDSEFSHTVEDNFICIYCHTGHNFQEIWNV